MTVCATQGIKWYLLLPHINKNGIISDSHIKRGREQARSVFMALSNEEWWEAAKLMWQLSRKIAKDPEKTTSIVFFKGVMSHEAETIAICKSLHRWFHDHDIGMAGEEK